MMEDHAAGTGFCLDAHRVRELQREDRHAVPFWSFLIHFPPYL